VIDDLCKLAGASGIGSFRNSLALSVLLGTIPVSLLTASTPQLPARVFLPLVLLSLWWSLGAAPLQIFFDDPIRMSLALSAMQAAAAGGAFLGVRYGVDGPGWTLPSPDPEAPVFAPLRFAGFTVAALVVGPLLLGGYGVLALATAVHDTTSGFIAFDGRGIHLVERRYQKGGSEIRLVGMVHIAREGTYERIFESFALKDTLVLEEGVTDDQDLLADRLPYDALVEPLGLAKQVAVSQYFADGGEDAWPHVRRADLDTSDFGPETIAYMRGLDDVIEAVEARDWDAAGEVFRQPAMNSHNLQLVMHDIVTRRDEHLASELEAAIGNYQRVIVPWGALHQRRIVGLVEDWGFVETHSARHLAVEWSELLDGLLVLTRSAAAPEDESSDAP
jgi:hypothetical protein